MTAGEPGGEGALTPQVWFLSRGSPPSGPTQAPSPPKGARRPSGIRGLCWQMSTICIKRAALYTGRLRPLRAPGTRPGSTLNTRAQVMPGSISVLIAAGTAGQSGATPCPWC